MVLWGEAMRVPLIINGPVGGAAGAEIDAMVELKDVGPTILEMAGLDRPSSFTGKSLVSEIGRQSADPASHRIAMSLTVGGLRSIIDRSLKAIERVESEAHPASFEVFNLAVDPGEHAPLEAVDQAVVNHLREKMKAALAGQDLGAEIVTADEVEDEELLEQLRALGYLTD